MGDISKLTLVCGGGGVWGVAWMTGLAAGLRDAGIDVRQAESFVGTSAGSVVSTQLACGLSLNELFERQTNPAKQPNEPLPTPGAMEAMADVLQRPWPNNRARLEALRNLAVRAQTISPGERRANVVERLGLSGESWPDRALSITALDLETLELHVLRADSGVPLADAVSASCALPGVWPPAPVGGRRYIDGGFWRTPENAHVASAATTILILSPLRRVLEPPSRNEDALAADIARLESAGAQVALICADDAALTALSPGPLDPSTRAPAAKAGRAQGLREAERVRSLLDRP